MLISKLTSCEALLALLHGCSFNGSLLMQIFLGATSDLDKESCNHPSWMLYHVDPILSENKDFKYSSA